MMRTRAHPASMTASELRQRAVSAASNHTNAEPGSVGADNVPRSDVTAAEGTAPQDDNVIRERAAAALAAHNEARAAPKPASCVRRLLSIAWIAVCAFFSYNVMMNGVEQPLFSSPSLSVYGHQFFRLSVCSVTRAPLDRWTAPHKDANEYARRLRAAFVTACPKREVDAFDVGLDKFGAQRAHIVRWAGIVFCVAAPLFCFFSSASVPAALALLAIRVALRGATLNAGFVALLSYTGLHAFFLLWNRFKGGA